jgi:tight adherence protein C
MIDPVTAASGLVALGVFVFVGAAVLLIWRGTQRGQLKRRLDRLEERPAAESDAPVAATGLIETVVRATGPFARLALPDQDWEKSPLRLEFMHAGWRSSQAPALFFGAKGLLTIGLPSLALVVFFFSGRAPSFNVAVLILAALGIAGLYLPTMTLKKAIESRQQNLIETFPDALDLLTVCVEAGLSLEASLARVAQEMAPSHPLIATELQLVVLEMRAGRGREEALRNLAKRNGVDDIESLVGTLIQSEQFGVSVADSLRTHSDTLRGRRRQKAEERASTVGTRLTFPLLVCILPTLMIVVAGPAVIKLADSFKVFGGQ